MSCYAPTATGTTINTRMSGMTPSTPIFLDVFWSRRRRTSWRHRYHLSILICLLSVRMHMRVGMRILLLLL